MSFLVTRCNSTYHFITNDKVGSVHIIRCGLEDDHDSTHTGRTVAGLSIHWTDEAAENARVYAAKYVRRKDAEDRERRERAERERRERTTAKIRKTVYGWRVWDRTSYGDHLKSLNGIRWEGPNMKLHTTDDGTELRRVHWDNVPVAGRGLRERKPSEDHGLYSYKSPRVLLRFFYSLDSRVVGRVRVLGHTVVHQLGYRSQRLVVDELWVPYRKALSPMEDIWSEEKAKWVQRKLEKNYDCPVHTIDARKLKSWARYYESEYPTPPELEEDYDG